MLLQGLTLTIVGMSVVFIFLTILVFVMMFLSSFIPKYFPDDKLIKQSKPGKTTKDSITKKQEPVKMEEEAVIMGEAEIAAVIAAVKSYSKI